jgi:hypothetical protein
MAERDEVVSLDVPWLPHAGDSMPVVSQYEWFVAITYRAAVSTGHFGQRVLLQFDRCLVSQFGYPNDEALPGHPLYARGLTHYGIFEVKQSSWLDTMQEQNRQSFPEVTDWCAGLRHFVVTFHDSSFACLATDLEGSFVSWETREIVRRPRRPPDLKDNDARPANRLRSVGDVVPDDIRRGDEVPPYVTREMSADEALAHVLRWLDTSPSDEMLGRAALTQLEPLVDWHWRALEDDLLGLLAERADLRVIVRDCVFDDSVPDEVAERLYAAAAAR